MADATPTPTLAELATRRDAHRVALRFLTAKVREDPAELQWALLAAEDLPVRDLMQSSAITATWILRILATKLDLDAEDVLAEVIAAVEGTWSRVIP